MRFDLPKYVKFGLGCLILAIVFLVLYFVVPDELRHLIGVAALLLVTLSGLIFTILGILALIEILTSNNDTGFKILWVIVILLLGIIGLALYILIGRKTLS